MNLPGGHGWRAWLEYFSATAGAGGDSRQESIENKFLVGVNREARKETIDTLGKVF